MASTYSDLKIELIGTGEQSGTWGTTTNTNLGTAIEQAIVGMATISSGFTGSPLTLTLTLTDTNAAQNARALVLNLTQSLGSAGTLNVPAIQKPYMIINATGQTVTVKVTGQTGVAVPTGTRTFLYNNGTDVGSFFNYAASLTLGTDLAVADGGTGASSAPAARTNLGASTVGSNLFTLTNPSAITFIRINADNTVTALSAADFRTAIGAGTGGGSVTSVATSNGPAPINGLTLTGGPITSTGTVTLGGGVNVSTITTGILPVANGGTGVNAAGTSGNVLTSNGTAWVSQAAGGGANIQTFAASGTYTKPPGAKFLYVELWGAGGGGSNKGGTSEAGGGGGGAYAYRMLVAPEVGATEPVSVGAGGGGGVNGGNTTFGTLVFAGGGFGAAPPAPGFGSKAGGCVNIGPLASPGAGQSFTNLQNAYAYGSPITSGTTMYGYQSTLGSIWGGGAGRTDNNGTPSVFGGGGGGGSFPNTTAYAGGRGNFMFKGPQIAIPAPGAGIDFSTGGGGAIGTNGGAYQGGGGQTAPAGPAAGNGGLAAGGGGKPSPTGQGSGGNGYAIVYTW